MPHPGRGRRQSRRCLLARAGSLDPARASWRRDGRACAFSAPERETCSAFIQSLLGVLKQLQPALRRIEAQDRDLGRQLRRASASIALNLGEGMYSRGHNRHARYHTALGSARETLSCLEVAALSSYLEEDAQLWDQRDCIVGTLVLLTRAQRCSMDRRTLVRRPVRQPVLGNAAEAALIVAALG